MRIVRLGMVFRINFIGQNLFPLLLKENKIREVVPALLIVNCMNALCLVVFGYKLWKLRKTAQISDANTPTSVPQGIQMEQQADPTIQEILNVPIVQDEQLCCICLEVLPYWIPVYVLI